MMLLHHLKNAELWEFTKNVDTNHLQYFRFTPVPTEKQCSSKWRHQLFLKYKKNKNGPQQSL